MARFTKAAKAEATATGGDDASQVPAILHVFAHGDAWLVVRPDLTVLQQAGSRKAARAWVKENARGVEVVQECPTGWAQVPPTAASQDGQDTPSPAEIDAAANASEGAAAAVDAPADSQDGQASNVQPALRELGDEVAGAEAHAGGMVLSFVGKPMRSKVKAITSALGAGPASPERGKPGVVLVCGHGKDGDCYSVGVLAFPAEKPKAAKAPAKAKADKPAAPVAGRGGAGRQEFQGVSMTAVLRLLGSLGATNAQAVAACEALGMQPNKATVMIQVRAGVTGARGGVPDVNAETFEAITKALDAAKAKDGVTPAQG